MTRITKEQRYLFIVLTVVAGFAIIDFIKNKDKYISFYSKNPKEQLEAILNKPTIKIPQKEQPIYQKDWKDDPFYSRPIVLEKWQSTPSNHFTLKAISYSQRNYMAIINNRILKVGDLIGGYRVLRIETNRVILGKGDKSEILKLK
jgi:hypothetical protein